MEFVSETGNVIPITGRVRVYRLGLELPEMVWCNILDVDPELEPGQHGMLYAGGRTWDVTVQPDGSVLAWKQAA